MECRCIAWYGMIWYTIDNARYTKHDEVLWYASQRSYHSARELSWTDSQCGIASFHYCVLLSTSAGSILACDSFEVPANGANPTPV